MGGPIDYQSEGLREMLQGDRQEEILDGKDYDSAAMTTENSLKKPILSCARA
ncbi:hypothetical protein BGX23_011025 [Mortierella sp. AD031]|nr:hypothetical protein BGX23_011025 [Mortierella sp. AD031]